MALKTTVRSGSGDGAEAAVDKAGALLVMRRSLPPMLTAGSDKLRAWTATFLNSAASADMRVDGSSTVAKFYISADQDNDIYVRMAQVVIADSGATLDKFGNLAALTNGVRFHYDTDTGETELSVWKRNVHLIGYTGGEGAFGDGATSFQYPNIGGSPGVEAYVGYVDFHRVYGYEWGLPLRAGSNQRLVITVRDDLSAGLDQFSADAHGLERLPD